MTRSTGWQVGLLRNCLYCWPCVIFSTATVDDGCSKFAWYCLDDIRNFYCSISQERIKHLRSQSMKSFGKSENQCHGDERWVNDYDWWLMTDQEFNQEFSYRRAISGPCLHKLITKWNIDDCTEKLYRHSWVLFGIMRIMLLMANPITD